MTTVEAHVATVATTVEAVSAKRLLSRYEGAWAALAERNAALCARGIEAERSVRASVDRCSAAAAGFQHLKAELQLVPSCTAQLREVAVAAAAAGEQLAALEARLDRLAVAQVRRSEAQWRQQQLALADEAQARRKQQLQQLRERMALQTTRRIEQEQEERQQVFQEQFEADRAYVARHGAVDELRRVQPHAAGSAAAPAVSLADMQPAAAGDALDDFYADD